MAPNGCLSTTSTGNGTWENAKKKNKLRYAHTHTHTWIKTRPEKRINDDDGDDH